MCGNVQRSENSAAGLVRGVEEEFFIVQQTVWIAKAWLENDQYPNKKHPIQHKRVWLYDYM